MWRVKERTVMLFFALLLILSFSAYRVLEHSFSGGVEADNMGLTIGQYEAPSIVYAQQYVYLNWTISDNDGKADIKNSTLELSNGIIIAYDSATDAFSKIQDKGNYLTIDASRSLRTDINSTAFRLSARVMFGWNYTQGNIDIVSAKVYDYHGKSGSRLKTDWFYFENDLIVYSASVDHDRVNPNDALTFKGTVYYEGTTIPPASGNSALSFDGVDDYVNVADSITLHIPSDLTVVAWVKRSSTGVTHMIVDKRLNSLTGFWLDIEGDDMVYGWIGDGSHSATVYTDGFTTTSGVWYNVALVREENTLRIYVNGEQKASADASAVGDITSTADLRIGRNYLDGQPFNGLIDEVRIYNRALSATEVNECYQGIYSNESGLVLYLPFDGDTLDHSRKGNHGTNYGATWTTGAYVNIDVKVERGGVLEQTVNIVNATNGSFILPNVKAPNKIGNYDYNIYAVTKKNSVQNQTVNVIVVGLPWYYPLVAWLASIPLPVWEGIGVITIFIVIIVALFRLGIITVEIKEPMEPTEELKRQINELLQPLAKEDRQSIILQRFLHQLLEKNPPPETIKFLQEYLPIIIKDIIEPKEGKDDEKTRKSGSDQ
jgi:hypothetical protein